MYFLTLMYLYFHRRSSVKPDERQLSFSSVMLNRASYCARMVALVDWISRQWIGSSNTILLMIPMSIFISLDMQLVARVLKVESRHRVLFEANVVDAISSLVVSCHDHFAFQFSFICRLAIILLRNFHQNYNLNSHPEIAASVTNIVENIEGRFCTNDFDNQIHAK
jgi:hypothetical protein